MNTLRKDAMLLPRGPYCCEEGERLRVSVCRKCAELNAGYQSCLGVTPDDIDADDDDLYEKYYCQCDEVPTEQELDLCKCSACGKQLI